MNNPVINLFRVFISHLQNILLVIFRSKMKINKMGRQNGLGWQGELNELNGSSRLEPGGPNGLSRLEKTR